MVGIGRVAHPEDKAEQKNGEHEGPTRVATGPFVA
jgi:hypothetical protein